MTKSLLPLLMLAGLSTAASISASADWLPLPPLRIYSQGNSVPDALSFKLRMTGAGVSCTSSGGFEVCTINGGISSVFADSPLAGNGTSGSHLTCTTCANDSLVVHLAGAESITGVKTFGVSADPSFSAAGAHTLTPATPAAAGGTGVTMTYKSGDGAAGDASNPGGVGGIFLLKGGSGGAASSAQVGGAGASVSLFSGGQGGSGSATQPAGAGGPVTFRGGGAGANNGGGGANGGDVQIDGGIAQGAGTHGRVLIGTGAGGTTSSITIGTSGVNTTFGGTGIVLPAGTTITNVGATTFRSSLANGGTVPWTFDTNSSFAGNYAYSFQTGGQPIFQFFPTGGGGPQLNGYDTSGGYLGRLKWSNAGAIQTDQHFTPQADNAKDLGDPGNGGSWRVVYGYQYAGIAQTATAAGAVTINPTAGETYTLTASGNITSLTLTAGKNGQIVTVALKQNAGGTATWSTTMVNCKLAGGVFTKTLTANAVDTITFRFDGTNWLETSRSLNLS